MFKNPITISFNFIDLYFYISEAISKVFYRHNLCRSSPNVCSQKALNNIWSRSIPPVPTPRSCVVITVHAKITPNRIDKHVWFWYRSPLSDGLMWWAPVLRFERSFSFLRNCNLVRRSSFGTGTLFSFQVKTFLVNRWEWFIQKEFSGFSGG